MDEPARVAFVCEGDAESHHAFSGIAKFMVDHLRQLGHPVFTFNASPGRLARWTVAALSFHPDRHVWQTRFRQGHVAAAFRAARVGRRFARRRDETDVVLQIGPALRPPGAGRIPFALFCDWNMALSIRFRDNPYSSAHGMSIPDAERINARHARIYRDAATVFTISDKLRDSFVRDYGLSLDRVLTVHAGPNMDASMVPATRAGKRDGHHPTILFAGKEFKRKGGDLLVASFRDIRRRLPGARLVILGPRVLEHDEPGVEFAGFLNKNDPRQFDRLAGLYADADVFCLPTRMEPFGIVVLEAMHFGLPCVTSDTWALPEMVLNGQTGYVVPVDDAAALSDRLLGLLQDPDLARRMGDAGRERARRFFTWEVTAQKMHNRLQAVAASAGWRSPCKPGTTRLLS